VFQIDDEDIVYEDVEQDDAVDQPRSSTSANEISPPVLARQRSLSFKGARKNTATDDNSRFHFLFALIVAATETRPMISLFFN
jgi:hypothetical protein